jgi:hypothetical protein
VPPSGAALSPFGSEPLFGDEEEGAGVADDVVVGFGEGLVDDEESSPPLHAALTTDAAKALRRIGNVYFALIMIGAGAVDVPHATARIAAEHAEDPGWRRENREPSGSVRGT